MCSECAGRKSDKMLPSPLPLAPHQRTRCLCALSCSMHMHVVLQGQRMACHSHPHLLHHPWLPSVHACCFGTHQPCLPCPPKPNCRVVSIVDFWRAQLGVLLAAFNLALILLNVALAFAKGVNDHQSKNMEALKRQVGWALAVFFLWICFCVRMCESGWEGGARPGVDALGWVEAKPCLSFVAGAGVVRRERGPAACVHDEPCAGASPSQANEEFMFTASSPVGMPHAVCCAGQGPSG